ncbi:RNaseH domain-containing protein [Streptomyces viridosporus]|uniref:RNaseH domain-containing protein n=1 Tax=Streptomyces viridosporus TaxID=67581 RepID=UPI00343683DE
MRTPAAFKGRIRPPIRIPTGFLFHDTQGPYFQTVSGRQQAAPARVNAKGKVTIDTDKAAWNPGLVELAALGCHPGDGEVLEALALTVHQLRQAPVPPDALSLPLPLHLAGLAQEYMLLTRNEDDTEAPTEADPVADAGPDTVAAPGVATAQKPEEPVREHSVPVFPTQASGAEETRSR